MNNNAILNSQPNFRDVGGVITKSGKKVKANLIFRSGFLGKLNKNDLSIIEHLQIGKIVDLRTAEEIDLIGNEIYPAPISYKNIAINAGNISKLLIPIFEKGEFNLIPPDVLNTIYFNLITKFQPELAAVFREIINTNNGIIYHCSHGKDRTGVITALLLDYFEVDRDYIYKDYLMSNTHLKQQNTYYLQMIKDNFNKQFNKEVSEEEFTLIKSLFYVTEDNLKGVFKYIDTTYGSVNNYFKTELCLTDLELDLLKSKYLE